MSSHFWSSFDSNCQNLKFCIRFLYANLLYFRAGLLETDDMVSEKVGWNSRYILRKFHQKSLIAWLWKLIKTFVFSFENDCSRVFHFRSFHLSIFSLSVFSLSIFSFSIFWPRPGSLFNREAGLSKNFLSEKNRFFA